MPSTSAAAVRCPICGSKPLSVRAAHHHASVPTAVRCRPASSACAATSTSRASAATCTCLLYTSDAADDM
eukprot:2763144-Prymnesium_polylepis.1